MKLKISLLLCLALCSALSSCARAQVTLVENGKSTFTVIVPADAPSSVQNAAQELQKDIELATGAKLPLQKDSEQVATPIISLGSTRQAKAANLSSEKMPDEAYRIVTQNGNLFILGPDTPDGGWTQKNGQSNGTANGVYSLLEDYLGVRWLFPGELGRDVPARSTLALEKIDRTQKPLFNWRRVSHMWDFANKTQLRSIREWMERQRQGGAARVSYGHSWWRTLNGNNSPNPNTPAVRAIYKEHPEWFAMNAAGERPLPTGKYNKLETTNQDLVRWFAERAIAAMKNSDRPGTYALSPSDGERWSQSPESKALYEPIPSALYDPESPKSTFSTSSLVLKWYHDVAQIVAKEYPQGKLGGFIYSSYIYPPTKVQMKLPDNFTPVIAPSMDYGYGLYRPATQDYFKTVTDAWGKVVSGDWYYYDLPAQLLRQYEPEVGSDNFPGSSGIITPAAPDILNTIFPQLVKNHIKGGIIYGAPAWSNTALANYLLAKMMWNPKLNADDLQREWLRRAYGPQAGTVMEQFYNHLNDWFREYYQQNPTLSYKLTVGMMRDLYGAHYPEMEKLFLQAKAQPMSEVQQQRLQLLEQNLRVLQWRLRNAGFLPQSFTSPLAMDDAQINALLTRDNAAFPLFPGIFNGETKEERKAGRTASWQVKFTPDAVPASGKALPHLRDNQFLLYAAQDGEIRITPKLVTHGIYFGVYDVQDHNGQTMASGLLGADLPITFPAKAGHAYTLTIPARKTVNYQLRVENAAVAAGEFQNNALALSGPAAKVLMYYVPGNAPVGVFAENGAVTIKKPYSGALIKSLMEKGYSGVRVLNALDDGWKFSTDPQNNGLQRGVARPDFDDSSWTPISPLDWWQNQGFRDYHGVGWYRIKFTMKPLLEGERARLYFGAVDGNAVVYLNGVKISEHQLGENFKGWDRPFSVDITYRAKPGENTIALQVTGKNDTTNSGLFKGAAIAAGKRIK